MHFEAKKPYFYLLRRQVIKGFKLYLVRTAATCTEFVRAGYSDTAVFVDIQNKLKDVLQKEVAMAKVETSIFAFTSDDSASIHNSPGSGTFPTTSLSVRA